MLFTYREIPNETTSFSPFKLLYGWPVRGPLDILKDEWQGCEKKSDKCACIYVQGVREKLERLQKLAGGVEYSSKKKVMEWFDKTAWSRSFMAGDKYLSFYHLSPISFQQNEWVHTL